MLEKLFSVHFQCLLLVLSSWRGKPARVRLPDINKTPSWTWIQISMCIYIIYTQVTPASRSYIYLQFKCNQASLIFTCWILAVGGIQKTTEPTQEPLSTTKARRDHSQAHLEQPEFFLPWLMKLGCFSSNKRDLLFVVVLLGALETLQRILGQ